MELQNRQFSMFEDNLKECEQSLNFKINELNVNNDDCIICFKGFTKKNKKFKLKCGHDQFHADCVNGWFKK